MDAVVVCFYDQPSSWCVWPACPVNQSPLLRTGAVDTICTASYCGCSSTPTSCRLYLFWTTINATSIETKISEALNEKERQKLNLTVGGLPESKDDDAKLMEASRAYMQNPDTPCLLIVKIQTIIIMYFYSASIQLPAQERFYE